MLFQILRAFLRDEEFYRINTQLSQAMSLLSEYHRLLGSTSAAQINPFKDALVDERHSRAEEDKEKVDPDFLSLVWASIATALVFGGYAAKRAPRLAVGSSIDVADVVWLVLSFGALIFIATNSMFAISLTKRYAESKADKGYQLYTNSLGVGILLLIICAIILYMTGYHIS
jgi:hypothetical protein